MPEAIWALAPVDLPDGKRTLVAGIGAELVLFDLESRPLRRPAIPVGIRVL